MKKTLITPLFAAATLSLITACGGADEPVAPADTAGDDTEVTVPSQDEADAAAADAITEDNADEELDKLMDEIDG